ncbi:MAG: hypothetical protein V3W31_00085, partial [Thermodesulfobacteriota bacterium]
MTEAVPVEVVAEEAVVEEDILDEGGQDEGGLEEEEEGRITRSFRVRYLFSIDGLATGRHFNSISAVALDETAEEIYVFDKGNNRVVITDW